MANHNRSEVVFRYLLHSSISNYIGTFITVGAWFLLTPFMLQQLGTTVYGLWVLVGSVTGYGLLLDLGITGALTKFIAEYRVRGETEQARSLVVTALCFYCALGLIVVALSAAIAPIFPHLFNVAPDEHAVATQLVFLSGLGVGLSIPCATTQAVLRGLQRFDLTNLISIVSSLLTVVATVAVLLLGGGVIGVVMVSIAVTLIMQVPGLWCIHRIAPDLRFVWRGASWKVARTVVSFSSWLFVLRVGGYLETRTDEIVIGAFLPMNAVTSYNIARKLSTLPQILTEQFVRVLLPLASELHAENDTVRLRSLYIVSTRLTLAIFLLVGCALVVMARPVLSAWVGAPYADYAHLVLILACASFIDASTWPAGLILQGMARHRVPALLSIYTGLANIVLSIVLVHFYGLMGVALGTLIPTTIVCLGFVLPYAMRNIGVGATEALNEIFLPALLPAVPMTIILYVFQRTFEPSSLLSITLVAGIGGLVYMTGYLSIGASDLERQACRNYALSTIRLAESWFKRT
jgi:O-antigen/teichoic acid export membrane protein